MSEQIEVSAEYSAAIEAHNAAQRVHNAVVAKYRAGEVNDGAFIKSLAAYRVATAAFDEAFNAEVSK